LDLSPAQTTSASKHSFAAASDVDTARQICQTLFSWWGKAMSGCLQESTTIKPRPAPPPPVTTQQYSLWHRPHDRQMPDHTGHLADKNFLIRMLFKDSY